MVNIEFLKKQILAMDVKSDEFFELYCAIADKYYTFPDPDDFQKSAMVLRMYIDKANNKELDSQLIAFEKILTQLFVMEKEGTKACMFTLEFADKEYHFTMATDPKQIKQMEKMLAKVVKGDFKIKTK